MKPSIAARLAHMVRKNKYLIGTGFLSTPFICHMLSDYGYLEEVYACSCRGPVEAIREGGKVSLRVGSATYSFAY